MLAPWKKSYNQHYFANKSPSSHAFGFFSSHVWMWELDYKESWGPKIDVFELWCWRRLLKVPLTARRSNQCIVKEISPEYSFEGLMLKLHTLATWCKELTHLKRPWCWETLKAGGKGDDRGWDGWMASPTLWTWVWVNSRISWWTGRSGTLQSMRLETIEHGWASEVRRGSRQTGHPSAMWGHSEKKAIYEHVGCHQKPNLPSPRSWTSSPPELWDSSLLYKPQRLWYSVTETLKAVKHLVVFCLQVSSVWRVVILNIHSLF